MEGLRLRRQENRRIGLPTSDPARFTHRPVKVLHGVNFPQVE
jgi:hypothetical protein